MLSEEYVIEKFYTHVTSPSYNKHNNSYQGGCPICREGKSRGRKRRCYYIPSKELIFCHNCGWSTKPLKWIVEVSGLTSKEVYEDSKEYRKDISEVFDNTAPLLVTDTLPVDCINLFDKQQVEYYKDSEIVKLCNGIVTKRRINTAINRCDYIYTSIVDKFHKDRLIIPFTDTNNQIVFYQSRAVTAVDKRDTPRYKGKFGGEKIIFNIDKLDPDISSCYIFEGPIDSMFMRNGVGVGGITEKGPQFTRKQQEQYDTIMKWYDIVWVLDSQWQDSAAYIKSKYLLDNGHKVFVWPEEYGTKFKDINEMCIALKIDEVPESFIRRNTFEGIEGTLRLIGPGKYIT